MGLVELLPSFTEFSLAWLSFYRVLPSCSVLYGVSLGDYLVLPSLSEPVPCTAGFYWTSTG